NPPVPSAAPVRSVKLWIALASACVLLIPVAPAAQSGVDRLDSLERTVAADPENLRAAADYRQAAIGSGQFDRPIDVLEKLAKRKGSGPNVQISLALAYVDKVPTSGDIRRLHLGNDAINALSKSIALQPSILAYYVRGLINLFYNNLIFHRIPKGIADLQQALSLVTAETPRVLVARIYTSLGDGHWRSEDRARAREIWSTGASRAPGNAALAIRLGEDATAVRWAVSDSLNASVRVDTSLRELFP